MNMNKLGSIRVLYTDMGKKKSATGQGVDMGSFIRIDLRESKRRSKFDRLLIPWNNVIKVIVFN